MIKRALSQLDRAVTRSGSGTKLVGHGSGAQPLDTPPDTPTTLAPDARTSDAIIEAMPAQYFEPDFESLQHELAALPSNVNESFLESLVEGRTHELEVCGSGTGHIFTPCIATRLYYCYAATHRRSLSAWRATCWQITTNLSMASTKLAPLKAICRPLWLLPRSPGSSWHQRLHRWTPICLLAVRLAASRRSHVCSTCFCGCGRHTPCTKNSSKGDDFGYFANNNNQKVGHKVCKKVGQNCPSTHTQTHR